MKQKLREARRKRRVAERAMRRGRMAIKREAMEA